MFFGNKKEKNNKSREAVDLGTEAEDDVLSDFKVSLPREDDVNGNNDIVSLEIEGLPSSRNTHIDRDDGANKNKSTLPKKSKPSNTGDQPPSHLDVSQILNSIDLFEKDVLDRLEGMSKKIEEETFRLQILIDQNSKVMSKYSQINALFLENIQEIAEGNKDNNSSGFTIPPTSSSSSCSVSKHNHNDHFEKIDDGDRELSYRYAENYRSSGGKNTSKKFPLFLKIVIFLFFLWALPYAISYFANFAGKGTTNLLNQVANEVSTKTKINEKYHNRSNVAQEEKKDTHLPDSVEELPNDAIEAIDEL